MKEISFVKYSGAGNDFILIDLTNNNFDSLTSGEIKKMCARHTGIGADGILLFNDSKNYDFELQYFNADGSTGTLCGNGARCAIDYAIKTKQIKNKSVEFYSNNKKYSGEYLDNNTIKFNLIPPDNIFLDKKIKIDKLAINYSFADTGSPHAVINIDELIDINTGLPAAEELAELDVERIGKKIRYSKIFAPGGVNVNFIQYQNGELKMRTYERGVEAETLSCGTGAAAAALIETAKGFTEPPISINTESGKKLLVNFKFTENQIKELSLTGTAELIYRGTLTLK